MSEIPMTLPGDVPDPKAESATAPQTRAPRRGRLTDLGTRILSSLILAGVAVSTLLTGGIPFAVAWLAAALAVYVEWQRLIGGQRLVSRLAAGSAAICAATWLAYAAYPGIALLALVLGACVCGYVAERGRRGWSAAGVLYAGSLVISVLTLRPSFPFGERAVGWLFAVVWGTDVVAYFAGRLIGGPRFAPQISPSKTWAGTLVGMVGGAALGSLFLLLAGYMSQVETPSPVLVLFLLGLITSAVAQAGDLFESWTKRCFGAKDSGALIPGHGGIMDRLDGFIAAAAWVALLGTLHGLGFPSPAEGLFHWM
jgi:phosphatidate cytidylyltransferase